MTEQEFVPDFSGDDFANDKAILAYRARIQANEQMRQNCFQRLETEFGLKKSGHINLKRFEMFRSLSATIKYSMKSEARSDELRVSVGEYHSVCDLPKLYNSGFDEYFFGHMKLRFRYPHTYIRKETIKDKIEDVFLKRDLDFADHKKFSRGFLVLTHDPIRLYNLFQSKPLDELAAFPEAELEFLNDRLLFRCSRKPMTEEETEEFCELTHLLIKLFGSNQ